MARSIPMFLLTAVCATTLVGAPRFSGADENPKHTIKDVMKEHKKGGLKDKVLEGSATAEEKKQLVELYTEMGKNKPPKGSEESWKKLGDALVKGAKAVADGKEGGIEELKKGVNCGACHSAHKG